MQQMDNFVIFVILVLFNQVLNVAKLLIFVQHIIQDAVVLNVKLDLLGMVKNVKKTV